MSYEISLGLLEDISRICSEPQNFTLRIESYNHSIYYSPPVHLSYSNWDYNYAFVGSAKQIINFQVCTLHQNRFKEVIATGKLDIRDYVARYRPPDNFDLRLVLDSVYNNQVILHMRLRFSSQFRSRNDGLKQIRFPKNYKPIIGTEMGYYEHIAPPKDKNALFKGACESRNFFSFLDTVYKGQQYNFIQPSKSKK